MVFAILLRYIDIILAFLFLGVLKRYYIIFRPNVYFPFLDDYSPNIFVVRFDNMLRYLVFRMS